MNTKHDIAIILIKVLSLYLLLQSLSILPTYVQIYSETPTFLLTSQQFLSFILSILLWFLAPFLAKTMIKKHNSKPEQISNFSGIDFEQILFSAIGLILLAISIPGAISIISYNVAINSTEVKDIATKVHIEASSSSFLAKYIAGIFLGCVFLVFSKILTQKIEMFRNKI
jgi:heme/copper-type cytochrome/quinol oxidase subunit 2